MAIGAGERDSAQGELNLIINKYFHRKRFGKNVLGHFIFTKNVLEGLGESFFQQGFNIYIIYGQ